MLFNYLSICYIKTVIRTVISRTCSTKRIQFNDYDIKERKKKNQNFKPNLGKMKNIEFCVFQIQILLNNIVNNRRNI